ncbi:MAG: phosphatidylinositol mannoside acyltransferase [Acidimicrobiia bacterium]|nr:phosphatidylinositol mannoside acyltransferase [Acidimicrobiia bacterium]
MPSRALRLFHLGSWASRHAPAPVASAASGLAGAIAVAMAGDKRQQVERNLRRIHGRPLSRWELQRGVQATFANYARYWIESFRLPGTPPEVLDAGIAIEGWEHVEAGLERGHGVILALPHLGSWEWAGFWVAACKEVPISVVVESLEPRDVYEWFVGLRESFGMHVIPLGPRASSEVLAALRANHLVCLLSDRDISGSGIEVEFFGETTTLPAGPATLALRTGAALIPTAALYEGGHRRGIVRPALDPTRTGPFRQDVRRLTQELAHELEAFIRLAPEQWHLLQPNWPSDALAAEPA